jgi:hypothetical protein
MLEQIKEAIVSKLQIKLKETNLSSNQASKILGISNATLSNMQSHKWDNISDNMWRIVQNWVGYSIGWNVVPTDSINALSNMCRQAQYDHSSVGISDEPGRGKTTALRWYANSNPNVYYVECEEYWSKKVFVQKILQSMGLDDKGQNVYQMVDRITEILNAEENPLLILDEADKLKDAALQLFKTFYNKTNGNAGFVLAGAPYLRERITRGCRLDKQAYKEILSRLGGDLLRLKPVSINEVMQIMTINGLDEVSANILYNKNKPSDMRVVKRLVEKELLNQKHSKRNAA